MRLVAVAIGLGMLSPGSMAMAQPAEPAPAQPPFDQPAPPIVGPDDSPRPITPPPAVKPKKKGDRDKGEPQSPTDEPPIGTTVPPESSGDPAAPAVAPPVTPAPPSRPPIVQPNTYPQPYAPPPRLGVPPWQRPPPPVGRKRPRLGTSEDGLPLGYRGVIGLYGSVFADGQDVMAAGFVFAADIPLGERAFVTGRMPFAFTADNGEQSSAVGNVMLGARGVIDAADSMWFGVGGRVGLPLVTEEAYDPGGFPSYVLPPVPNGLWNLHEYYPDSVPLLLALHFTAHTDVGIVIRAELEPVVMIDYVRGDNAELTLQHAVELQFGRDLGGGLRVQGVALPTFDEIEVDHEVVDGDLYQLALEPFFRVERKRYHFRSGVMLPLDETLGPPFASSWGFRMGAGVRL
jgi:hypothetical protein